MHRRLLRFATPQAVAQACAEHLLDELIARQADRETVHLCLTGGRIANELYTIFGSLVPGSGLDTSRLQLWWGDERFVPLIHPDRNSQQALAILAKSMPISSANTHLMPAVDGKADPTEAAYAYAQDLGDIEFDICLLGVGPDGHVASIFPHHPSFEASGTVIGVTDAPKPPSERISLTLPTLNRSRDVWIIAVGSEKADAITRGVAGDPELPVSHLRGRHSTLWWLDEESAANLPHHRCEL